MEQAYLPTPEQVQQRIESCEDELRQLRRLLRISVAMSHANEARQRRDTINRQEEVSHAG
jgi:hypothetical protein